MIGSTALDIRLTDSPACMMPERVCVLKLSSCWEVSLLKMLCGVCSMLGSRVRSGFCSHWFWMKGSLAFTLIGCGATSFVALIFFSVKSLTWFLES